MSLSPHSDVGSSCGDRIINLHLAASRRVKGRTNLDYTVFQGDCRTSRDRRSALSYDFTSNEFSRATNVQHPQTCVGADLGKGLRVFVRKSLSS